MLEAFREFLIKRKCSVNTISVHLRTLRAIYNKAIKEKAVSEDLYPFKNFKISTETTKKRAIKREDIEAIIKLDLSSRPDLDYARDLFLFSFFFRGMSFVDIAFLKVSDIIGDRLYYTRKKTRQKFSIKITEKAWGVIKKYNDLSNKKSYIFPILQREGEEYLDYRNAMRLVNKKLKKLSEMAELSEPITTYTARHSWATIAKRSGIPTAIISEGLGHDSEETTQIYLDSFENDVLDQANEIVTG
jgi:integrase